MVTTLNPKTAACFADLVKRLSFAGQAAHERVINAALDYIESTGKWKGWFAREVEDIDRRYLQDKVG